MAAGYLAVALAGIMWGSLGVWAKMLFALGLAPGPAVTLRAVIGFIFLAAALGIARPQALKVDRSDLPFFAFFGFGAVTAFYLLYFTTISLTTIGTAAILLYTAPAFVNILARLIFNEPLTPAKLAALGLSWTGIFLVIGAYQPAALQVTPLAVATGLGSGFTYALYTILSKRLLQAYSHWTVLFYGLGFGALFLGILQAPAVLSSNLGIPALWPPLLIVSLVTVAAYAFYTWGISRVPVGRASIVAMVEPVAAGLLGFIVLGERFEPAQLLGAVLVLGGAVLAQRPDQPGR
jgi:drug/metabolite transporter (DMT)-like permease